MVAQAVEVEQDARDDERPGERPAPRLVGTRDEAHAEPAVEREEPPAGQLRHPARIAPRRGARPYAVTEFGDDSCCRCGASWRSSRMRAFLPTLPRR